MIRKTSRKPSAPAKRARRAAAPLNREAVVDEAIRLLGEEGLDGLSLRSLAARLSVRAPSLYWHFPDKATVLGAMMERIFLGCLEAVPNRRHWQEWMREFAEVLWKTQEGLRDFGRLLLSTPLEDEQIDRIDRELASRLSKLDIPLEDAMRMQASVQVLVTGWFIFAHTPFSPALSRKLNFRARMEADLALLLEGEARRR